MVVELCEALNKAGPADGKAQAVARALSHYDARLDELETAIDTGLARVKVQITLLKRIMASSSPARVP